MEEENYNSALRFLSYRPRSEKEIRDNLLRKKVDLPIIEKIIAKLKEQKFVNDEEFAKWWIELRSRLKPKSIRFIKSELKYKGISGEMVDRIIHPSADGSEFIIQNDLERAKKLVEKRIERFRNLSKQETYQKLGSYLASKGFDWDTIKQSIDEVLDNGV